MANFKALNQLSGQITDAIKDVSRREVESLGKEIVTEMKDMISKGVSPIQGDGRFPGYKKGYPNSARSRYPGKRSRPVNLKLSGEFLDALTFKVLGSSPNYRVQVGFFDSENALKEKGHREGANGQEKRPVIPQGSETFAKSIQTLIIDQFRAALERSLKKKLR